MRFIDREKEPARLQGATGRPAGGLVGLRGRRRVGKTRLLLERCRSGGRGPAVALLLALGCSGGCSTRDAGTADAGRARSAGTPGASADGPGPPAGARAGDVGLAPDGGPAGEATGPAEAEDPIAALGPVMHLICPAAPGDRPAPVSLFVSPARPRAGAPLRVVIVSARDMENVRLTLEGEDGSRSRLAPSETWGGPPWAWAVVLPEAPAGPLRFCLPAQGAARGAACASVVVAAGEPAVAPSTGPGVWPVERAWDGAVEDLYAAWIARLFLTEPGMTAGWRPLHQALRDPRRNLLHDHLGFGEDDEGAAVAAVLAPDCGDAPYFLRAYFAWKLRLPFAAHLCLRGTPGAGPVCAGPVFTNLAPGWDGVADPVDRFNRFLADAVARRVHSGSARTLAEAEFSDFYPLPLTRRALRPGTIFVDPRGHVLILTRWFPGTRERIGTLFAIDGHPDQSISHKRFSPSTFFFSTRVRTGGFKAFRPLHLENGRLCFASNRQLETGDGTTGYSLEQYAFPDAAAFHAHLGALLNPFPPDPVAAYRDRMELLVELLVDREVAVRVAVDYMESTGWQTIRVPDGAEVFATAGPWEDYATPGRDLRLLIAADEVRGFPDLVRENPGMFRIPSGTPPDEVAAGMAAERSRAEAELRFAYRRSDGSEWTLTLGDFLGRLERFETAYNPNDCPEVRWGASEGTAEQATCAHRASAGQQRLIEGYRGWFAARRQPADP